jgi:cytochrome b
MPEAVSLLAGSRIRVWDFPIRLFHWLLVAAIAVAFLSAEEDSPLNRWHMVSGWVAAVLICFRIVWGFVGGEHARFSGLIKGEGIGHHIREMLSLKPQATAGHNPLGWIASLLLIIVSAVTIWTGALIVLSAGEAGEGLHSSIGWGLLALIALHVAAVLLMSALTRDNLVRAMVAGSKSADRHPDSTDARSPAIWAYLIGVTAVAAAIVGILSIDPKAFLPRTTEATEHGAIESGERQSGESRPVSGETETENDD